MVEAARGWGARTYTPTIRPRPTMGKGVPRSADLVLLMLLMLLNDRRSTTGTPPGSTL